MMVGMAHLTCEHAKVPPCKLKILGKIHFASKVILFNETPHEFKHVLAFCYKKQ